MERCSQLYPATSTVTWLLVLKFSHASPTSTDRRHLTCQFLYFYYFDSTAFAHDQSTIYSILLPEPTMLYSMLSSCTNRKRSNPEFSRSKRGTINNILEMRMLYFQKIAFIHFEFQQKTRQTTSCERTAKTTTTSSLKSLRKHQRSNSRDC